MSKSLDLRLHLSPHVLRWGLAAALVIGAAAEPGTESLTIATSYPAPSGVYNRMVTTGYTYLARDPGSRVGIGTTAPQATLEVNGSAAVAGTLSAAAATVGGQDVASHLVPAGAVMIFAGGCPGGWSRFSALDGAFPLGSSSYGSTGGSASSTHSHTISSDGNENTGDAYHTTSNVSGGWWEPSSHEGVGGDQYVEWVADGMTKRYGAHVHSGPLHNHGGATGNATVSTMPPYVAVVWCQKQ